MAELDLGLLKQLCETPGIAGREERVAAVVQQALAPLVDEIRRDPLGNVIAVKRGKGGPRVMIAAHMDEIGFIVRAIDDRGFIRLQPVGGFDPRVLPAQRVRVWTRAGDGLLGALQATVKPPHLQQAGDDKSVTINDLFVDLGLPAEEVKARVEIGDMVTLDRPCEVLGPTVLSKALDDRVGIFVMIETLRTVKEHVAEIIAVATTQEEVGLRGAQVAAFGIDPDIGIALDTTIAGDVPGFEPEGTVTKLGAGVGIKVFDTSQLPNPALVQHLRSIADREGIPYQLEVLPRGGTDGGAIQRTRAGVPTTTLSVPSRYVHSVNEMAHRDDIAAAVQLLTRFLEEAHTGHYVPGA